MMRVKYKVNRACDCTTICKYDNSRFVGSYACRGCKFYAWHITGDNSV